MKYEKNIDNVFGLTITNDNKATVTGDTDQTTVTVQLTDDAMAQKMIKEFEDDSGEMMQEDDSVFKHFPELHVFIP